MRDDTGSLVHVYLSSGFHGESTFDIQRIEDEIGFIGREGHAEEFIGSFATGFADPFDILSVGLEMNSLRSSVGGMEMQVIGDEDGVIHIRGVDIDAHKDIHTVPAVELQVGYLRELGFTVYIDFEGFAFIHPYPVDKQGIRVAVIELHLHGSAALFGEDGIEMQGVARDSQAEGRIIADLKLFTTRKMTQDNGQKSKDYYVSIRFQITRN